MTPNSSITSRNLENKLKGNQIRKISYFVEAKCAMAKRLAKRLAMLQQSPFVSKGLVSLTFNNNKTKFVTNDLS